MNRAVFLDRDGTINVDTHYLYKIEDWQFIDGSPEGMKLLCERGYKLFIITNQAGIGRGYYRVEDMEELHKYILESLEKYGVEITELYYCPHHPTDAKGLYKKNCNCRKPGTELIEKAIKDYDIDIANSFCIGDKSCDIKMGEKAGCKTILVKTGKGGKDGEYEVKPDFIFENLYEAARFITAS